MLEITGGKRGRDKGEAWEKILSDEMNLYIIGVVEIYLYAFTKKQNCYKKVIYKIDRQHLTKCSRVTSPVIPDNSLLRSDVLPKICNLNLIIRTFQTNPN